MMSDADYDLGYFESIRNSILLLIQSKDICELHEKLRVELAEALRLKIESSRDMND